MVTFIKNKLCNRMFLKTLDVIMQISTTLYFQSSCCKDFSVTETRFQLITTGNMYQFDEQRKNGTMTVDLCHCLKICKINATANQCYLNL